MVTRPDDPLVTIVIPVLNDTTALTSLLPTLPVDPSVQVVVVDGGEPHDDPASDALRGRHPAVEWARSAVRIQRQSTPSTGHRKPAEPFEPQGFLGKSLLRRLRVSRERVS